MKKCLALCVLAVLLCSCVRYAGPAPESRDTPSPYYGHNPLERGRLRGNMDAGLQHILGGSDFGLVVPPLVTPQIGPVLSVETEVNTWCDAGAMIIWDVLRVDPYGGWQFSLINPLTQYAYFVPEALDGATLSSTLTLAVWYVPEGTPEPSDAVVRLEHNGTPISSVTKALPLDGSKVLVVSSVSFVGHTGDRLQWVAGPNSDPFGCGGKGGGFWRLNVTSLGGE